MLGSRRIRMCPKVLSQGATNPSHQVREIRKEKPVFNRLEKGVFQRLGDKGKSMFTHSNESRRPSYHSSRKDNKSCYQSSRSRGTEPASKKHHNKRASSHKTEALTCMPSHVKTYDGSEDPEDHLKIFQAAAKVERWAMPTSCHMFNATLTGSARVWFDDLPPESVDSYDDLKEAFMSNFHQQKKCIKDPVEIHHIKQRKG
nr:reverse transcriptase domain-containing protein [Tanacetum cinerariifolium]